MSSYLKCFLFVAVAKWTAPSDDILMPIFFSLKP
jgi:hypothetical protein